jgi:beta-glucosidase
MSGHGSRPFPKDFLWGTATAGHQVEGGNVHSNWWAWEQRRRVNDGTVSGRACDYWNRYPEDHAFIAAQGHGVFRLGIEWARIESRRGHFDLRALDHYTTILQDLQTRGIKVCLTLNHWVVPQWFAAEGGWLAPRALAWWERFLRAVIPALAPCVDLWITLNEPMVPVLVGYVLGYHPPCRVRPFQAAKVFARLLRAHAIAYSLVHELVAEAPGGGPPQAGFAGAVQHVEPFHSQGVTRLLERPLAAFFEQVSFGAWEESLVTGCVALPFGRRQRVPDLAGSFDFVGLNYYMRVSMQVGAGTLANVKQGEFACPPGIETTQMGWQVYPPGFYEVVRAATKQFGKPIYITENGCASTDDAQRRSYLVTHLAQLQRAIADGSDVRGYFHWSLLDNFEWREGYTPKFGLVEVDFNDPELPRRPRPSAELFREVIEANALTDAIAERYAPGALARWQ